MPEHHHEETFMGRRLFSAPTLWQDWGDDPEHGDASYWELFTDLLLVAAASAVADNLRNDLSLSGVAEFVSLYMIICGGWLHYSHHYTSRFNDDSLTHSLLLFVFLVGMAVSIVNASYEHAQYFAIGVMVQRLAYLAMLHCLYVALYERCGIMTRNIMIVVMANMTLFGVMVLFPSSAWWLMPVLAFIELFGEMSFITIPRTAMVPINIEHSKDRLGVLCLVMMGETIISITMEYREYMEKDVLTEDVEEAYYTLLALAFLLVFMFTLLYFHMQPPPATHAFRRSGILGLATLVLHKLMGCSLLAVGVAIKVAVSAVVAKEQLTPFASRLLGIAVGSSMFNLLAMRLCHYGGRPKLDVSNFAHRLMNIWWLSVVIFSILPFCYMSMLDPVQVFLWQSTSLAAFCVLETSFTHVLANHIPPSAFRNMLKKEEAETVEEGEAHEGTSLLKS